MKKRARKQAGQQMLAELNAEVQTALQLLDQETADALIGEQTPEYQALIAGASAIHALEWALLKTHGLKQRPAALKVGGQTMLLILTLIHYAYALGIRRGRGEYARNQGEIGQIRPPGTGGGSSSDRPIKK